MERPDGPPAFLHGGDSLGIEKGAGLSIQADRCDEATLFMSSIPRRHVYIANLPDDMIFIAADEQPMASMPRLMVEAIRLELARDVAEIEVIRRLSEVIMLQLLRRVQVGIVRTRQTSPDTSP